MPKAEEVTPYNDPNTPKEEQVSRMFDSIARKYDLMNSLMTLGMHRRWRNYALRKLEIKEEHAVLDIATGTGDIVFKMRKYKPIRIIGVDISQGMLEIAQTRLKKLYTNAYHRITFVKADCCEVPYEDESFDRITVGYGVRNFPDRPAAFREMLRLLKPGGRVGVIELSEPTNRFYKWLYKFYTHKLIPRMGRMISKDDNAYTYLPKSIEACPQREEMAQLMRDAGFSEVRYRSLFPGAVTIYMGIK